ncbi:MAG TPA: PAS domain-containing protein, partial [Acidimicrobiales bacterium]
MAELPSAAAWADLLSAPDAAAVVTDASGVVVRWGQTATRCYGHTADEARGRSVIALLGVADEEEVARRSTARAAEGHVSVVRRRTRARSGEELAVVGAVVRVADEDGELRLVGLTVPAGDRPGPVGEVDEATAARLRLVAEARA